MVIAGKQLLIDCGQRNRRLNERSCMNFQIREGCKNDIGELLELLYDLFSTETDFVFNKEKQYQGLRLLLQKNEKHNLWVAETENRLVIGMCTVQVLISTAEGGEVGLVEDVVVRKKFRGHGVGRKLLQKMESWAVERNLTRIQLLADKTNIPGLQFYNKMDWQYTQLVCMRKMIPHDSLLQ